MATTRKSTTSEPVKMTPTQMRKKIAELETEIENYKENTAWCFMCGKPKTVSYTHLTLPTIYSV